MTEEVHDSSVLITEEVVYYRRAYPSWPLGPDLGIDRLKARREADLALGRQSASRTPLTAMIDEPLLLLLITTTSVIGPLATPPGARAQRTRPAHDRQGHLRTLLKDVAPRPPTLTANLAMHLCFDAALSCASGSPNMPFPSMPSCKPMTIAGRLFFHLPVLLLPLLLLPCHDDSLGGTSRSRRLPVLFRPALSGWFGWPSRPLPPSLSSIPARPSPPLKHQKYQKQPKAPTSSQAIASKRLSLPTSPASRPF